MLRVIQGREHVYGKGFLSSCPRARVSSLKPRGAQCLKMHTLRPGGIW